MQHELKTKTITMAGLKSDPIRVDGHFTIMNVETDEDWDTGDITFEASSEEFPGTVGFTPDPARFKECRDSFGQPITITGAAADGHHQLDKAITGHWFKVVSSVSQPSTVVRIHYRYVG